MNVLKKYNLDELETIDSNKILSIIPIRFKKISNDIIASEFRVLLEE